LGSRAFLLTTALIALLNQTANAAPEALKVTFGDVDLTI
jgi:hypothetical protein